MIKINVYDEKQKAGDVSDNRPEADIDAEDYEKLKGNSALAPNA